MSKYYNVCKNAFNEGTYTIDQVYKFTTLKKNALTADEFYQITGITLDDYLAE